MTASLLNHRLYPIRQKMILLFPDNPLAAVQCNTSDKQAIDSLSAQLQISTPTLMKIIDKVFSALAWNRLRRWSKIILSCILAAWMTSCATQSLPTPEYYRPYPEQLYASQLAASQDQIDDQYPTTVKLWPNPETEVLTSRPQTIRINEAEKTITLYKLPKEIGAAFGIWLPKIFINLFGYNPSLENAYLIFKVALGSNIDTLAFKLSPPSMPLDKLKGDVNSNTFKLTGVSSITEGKFFVVPMDGFYKAYSSQAWVLGKDGGGVLMFLAGSNVVSVHPELQRMNAKPSTLELVTNPLYAASVGDSAYWPNPKEGRITFIEIRIAWLAGEAPVTIPEADKTRGPTKVYYEQLEFMRKEEIQTLRRQNRS